MQLSRNSLASSRISMRLSVISNGTRLVPDAMPANNGLRTKTKGIVADGTITALRVDVDNRSKHVGYGLDY